MWNTLIIGLLVGTACTVYSQSAGYPKITPSNPLKIPVRRPADSAIAADEHTDKKFVQAVWPDDDQHHHHGSDDHHHHHGEDGKYDPNDDGTGWEIRKSIPGEPGKDYPTYHKVPTTDFTCALKPAGYLADKSTRCKTYHLCLFENIPSQTFKCPEGKLYNSKSQKCSPWYLVNCQNDIKLNRVRRQTIDTQNKKVYVSTLTTNEDNGSKKGDKLINDPLFTKQIESFEKNPSQISSNSKNGEKNIARTLTTIDLKQNKFSLNTNPNKNGNINIILDQKGKQISLKELTRQFGTNYGSINIPRSEILLQDTREHEENLARLGLLSFPNIETEYPFLDTSVSYDQGPIFSHVESLPNIDPKYQKLLEKLIPIPPEDIYKIGLLKLPGNQPNRVEVGEKRPDKLENEKVFEIQESDIRSVQKENGSGQKYPLNTKSESLSHSLKPQMRETFPQSFNQSTSSGINNQLRPEAQQDSSSTIPLQTKEVASPEAENTSDFIQRRPGIVGPFPLEKHNFGTGSETGQKKIDSQNDCGSTADLKIGKLCSNRKLVANINEELKVVNNSPTPGATSMEQPGSQNVPTNFGSSSNSGSNLETTSKSNKQTLPTVFTPHVNPVENVGNTSPFGASLQNGKKESQSIKLAPGLVKAPPGFNQATFGNVPNNFGTFGTDSGQPAVGQVSQNTGIDHSNRLNGMLHSSKPGSIGNNAPKNNLGTFGAGLGQTIMGQMVSLQGMNQNFNNGVKGSNLTPSGSRLSGTGNGVPNNNFGTFGTGVGQLGMSQTSSLLGSNGNANSGVKGSNLATSSSRPSSTGSNVPNNSLGTFGASLARPGGSQTPPQSNNLASLNGRGVSSSNFVRFPGQTKGNNVVTFPNSDRRMSNPVSATLKHVQNLQNFNTGFSPLPEFNKNLNQNDFEIVPAIDLDFNSDEGQRFAQLLREFDADLDVFNLNYGGPFNGHIYVPNDFNFGGYFKRYIKKVLKNKN